MSKRTELTRWNRAGLRRFRYVDANAAVFLEELRLRLAERFPQWTALAVPEGETAEAARARVLAQYEAAPGPAPDWGFEIARSFARACHVLGETIDAFANEGYLGTATQWPSLRRLAAMLDYAPAPPASASTPLGIVTNATGTLKKGFALKAPARSGAAPVIFETLADLDVDPSLNELHAIGWTNNPEPLKGSSVVLDGAVTGLAIGDPVVLVNHVHDILSAHVIQSVTVGDSSTKLRVMPEILEADSFTVGTTTVHAKPKDRFRLVGIFPVEKQVAIDTEIVFTTPPAGIATGDVIVVSDGKTTVYRNVMSLSGSRVVVGSKVGSLTSATASARKAQSLSVNAMPTAGVVVVFGDWTRVRGLTVGIEVGNKLAELEANAVDLDKPNAGYSQIHLSNWTFAETVPTALLVPQVGAGWSIDAPLDTAALQKAPADGEDTAPTSRPSLTTSAPSSTRIFDLVVAISGNKVIFARLGSASFDTERGQASLYPDRKWQVREVNKDPSDSWPSTTRVYGHFRERYALRAAQSNDTPMSGKDVDLVVTRPAALAVGRELLVRVDPKGASGELLPPRFVLTAAAGVVDLVDSEGKPAGTRVTLRHDLPSSNEDGAPLATASNLVIYGNVALAGHGERKTERVLGSGDAMRSGQSFVLQQTGVSFVADDASGRGVRADVDVVVDGRTWTQVPRLRDQGPTERVYVVTLSEEGYLVVTFGDGTTGRRLPTGRNNVRVRYRVGAGAAGNLPPGSLAKPLRKSPLVAAVRQPLAATGGSDREGTDSLRTTSPATQNTLQRAVSLADFAALAAGHASVWQADAQLGSSAGLRALAVEVVVVPAGGGPLGALADALSSFLSAHAVSGVDVVVKSYIDEAIKLDLQLEIDLNAFEPNAVVRSARAALLEAFSLRRRKLGQLVDLADVYRVVESVPGVANSRCVLGGDPARRSQRTKSRRGVITLSAADLTIDYRAFTS